MRLRPRFWIGGKVKAWDSPHTEWTYLWYCSHRWNVSRHTRARRAWWRVKGIAWSLQIGRWEIQHLEGMKGREQWHN